MSQKRYILGMNFVKQLNIRLGFLVFVSLMLVSLLAGCGAPPHPRLEEPIEKEEVPIEVSLEPVRRTKKLKEIEGGIQLVERHPEGPVEQPPQPTFIYDRNGKLLAELFIEERHMWIGLDQMSTHLIYATRSALEHAASAVGLKYDKRLLTIQLARLIRDGSESATLYVKQDEINERIIDQLVEAYSESELLALYINMLRYGPNAYGPEMAARTYFDKSAEDLTLAEATFLTALLSGQKRLSPITDFAEAKQRRGLLIEALVQKELVTEDQAREANRLLMPLQEVLQEEKEVVAPRFVQYVLDYVDEQLGPGQTIRSGWHIYTTLDLEMQKQARRLMDEKLDNLQARRRTIDSALVALKPDTAEILVMVDSMDDQQGIELRVSSQTEEEFKDVDSINQVLVGREPGGVIIPLVYAAAIEENLISPATVLWDVPARFAWNEAEWYIPFSSNLEFRGPMSARTALREGAVVPAAKLIDQLGVESLRNTTTELGISELLDEDTVVAVNLPIRGGQASLLELTGAYGALANSGIYKRTSPVRRIADARGESVKLQKPDDEEEPNGVSPETAFLVTDMLMRPLNPDLVAATPEGTELSPLAKRTAVYMDGVSSDHLNFWTAGYTPHMAVGIWLGETINHTKVNSANATYTSEIWREFVQNTLGDPDRRRIFGLRSDDEDIWSFEQPEGVENIPECPPYVECRPGSEYFSAAWLEKMGRQGPLGDSAVRVVSNEGFIDWQGYQMRSGFCHEGDGPKEILIRLPDIPELQGPKSHLPVPPIFQPSLPQEHLEILKWTMGYDRPVDFGPCSRIDRFVYSAMRAEWEIQRDDRPVIVEQAGSLTGYNPSRPVGQWPIASAYPSVYAPPPSVLPSPYRFWEIKDSVPEIPQEVLDSIEETTGITFEIRDIITGTEAAGTASITQTAENLVVALPTLSRSQRIPPTNTPVSASSPTPPPSGGAFAEVMRRRGTPTPLPESGVPRPPGSIRPFAVATPTAIPTNTPEPTPTLQPTVEAAPIDSEPIDAEPVDGALAEAVPSDGAAVVEAIGTPVADGTAPEAIAEVIVFTLTPTVEGDEVATPEPTVEEEGTPTPTRVSVEVTIAAMTPTPTGTLTPEALVSSEEERAVQDEATEEEDAELDETAEGSTVPALTEENYSVADQYPYSSCSGEQVVGTVIDASTNPLPGVLLKYVDQWGNELSVITGGSFSDYGLFTFDIPVETSHQIYITIVNDGGNPVSNTAVIDHKQADNVGYLCHYLVFRRID